MIAAHALGLVLLGYYSDGLHRAYSLWYVVGTALATMVPVVGWSPLRSLEQVAMLLDGVHDYAAAVDAVRALMFIEKFALDLHGRTAGVVDYEIVEYRDKAGAVLLRHTLAA
jgi:hypothetical protein